MTGFVAGNFTLRGSFSTRPEYTRTTAPHPSQERQRERERERGRKRWGMTCVHVNAFEPTRPTGTAPFGWVKCTREAKMSPLTLTSDNGGNFAAWNSGITTYSVRTALHTI